MRNEALISHIYTADPSANMFNNRIYIYPSHDVDNEQSVNLDGDHYNMVDYHVFSMSEIPGEVTDHGVALHLENVKWAVKQMWAPDAAEKNGIYYLYFPARDKENIFRIGVAVANKPEGPFIAEESPIKGIYSIDPCVFTDIDGSSFLYWGGLWGGQLENWRSGFFDITSKEPAGLDTALCAKGGRLTDDMLQISGGQCDIVILDEHGAKVVAEDEDKRYFEGPWMHRYNGVYYFSYSTGTTHKIAYATGDNPLGPFTYRGVVLNPVVGWTTHHSIVEFNNKWFLFYHDSTLSGGIDHKRCIKVCELKYSSNGDMQLINS